MFTLIDFENWERKEHYLHFYNDVRCSYSTCVNIDISNLNGQRLYPAMLWLLTQTINEMPEFRTALTEKDLAILVRCTLHTLFSTRGKRRFLGYGQRTNQIILLF